MQRAIQCSNYRGQESKEQFAVYDSNTPVTLKQGQGHQTWYELVDPKEGYNKPKFQKSCWNSVHEKANSKDFVKSVNRSISPLNRCEGENYGIFMTCLMYLTTLQSFNLIR